jgi:hypothetical protein
MTESVAVFVESTGVIDVVSAKQNAASTVRIEKIRSNNFIPSIYEDFGLKSAKFRENRRKEWDWDVKCLLLSHEFDFSNEKSFFSQKCR